MTLSRREREFATHSLTSSCIGSHPGASYTGRRGPRLGNSYLPTRSRSYTSENTSGSRNNLRSFTHGFTQAPPLEGAPLICRPCPGSGGPDGLPRPPSRTVGERPYVSKHPGYRCLVGGQRGPGDLRNSVLRGSFELRPGAESSGGKLPSSSVEHTSRRAAALYEFLGRCPGFLPQSAHCAFSHKRSLPRNNCYACRSIMNYNEH